MATHLDSPEFRQTVIERLEGYTGIEANWSSLTTKQLLSLLFLLLPPTEQERVMDLLHIDPKLL